MTDTHPHGRDSKTKNMNDDNPPKPTRRTVLKAAGIAGVGAAGLLATAGTADAAPSGTFPESTDDALLKIRADRIRFVPRTSDPSSPDGGEMWVVE